MQVWEIWAFLGISIVVICAAVLVRYGNSLSSTYGGSAGLVLGHDIAPSKLLEGLTLPALHRDFSPVCVFKLHCPVCVILGPGRRHHLQLSRHDRGKLHAAASQQTANHFFFKAVKDEDKEVRKSSLFWWISRLSTGSDPGSRDSLPACSLQPACPLRYRPILDI